jgi:crotonobetainyl-CoA:carnitine CoA-transferase CaiB-like acyl-CoA transferase
MLALRVKDKTGIGQQVDISMMEGQLALLGTAIANYFANGEIPKPLGTAYSVVVPYQTFHTKTRDLALAIAGEKLWRKFCPIMGVPQLLEDPRYVNTVERSKHRESLIAQLQEVFYTKSYEEWEKILLENDIPVGAINNVAQVVEHPQVKARHSLHEVDHPRVGKVRVVGSPVRLSKTPAKKPTPSPVHGQHTREVLKDVLGLTTDEIGRLEAAEVVKSANV